MVLRGCRLLGVGPALVLGGTPWSGRVGPLGSAGIACRSFSRRRFVCPPWSGRFIGSSSPRRCNPISSPVSQGFLRVGGAGHQSGRAVSRAGPYDERLGYTRIPAFVGSLGEQGYQVERQARLSPGLLSFIDLGGFPVYREKSQAGLTILDRRDDEIFRARYPERVFAEFESIPPLVVETLLFIENRELMDLSSPTRNPAVEWDRFAAASVNALVSAVVPTGQRFGGSTLATQIEKCRHSPDGRTASPVEKLRQIASASARAYQDGRDTTGARKRIVLDYINSTPLSARPVFGEIIGLGDGLYAWYGTDLAEAGLRLGEPPSSPAEAARRAQIYKQVLSLLLAQRRPSYYLLAGRDDLAALSNDYLRLLAGAGVIDTGLRDAAVAQPLVFSDEAPAPAETAFVEHKFLNAARARCIRPRAERLLRSRPVGSARRDEPGHVRPAGRHRDARALGRAGGIEAGRTVRRALAARRSGGGGLQRHPVRADPLCQPGAGAGGQHGPAAGSQRGRQVRPRLHRQAAHRDHLSGDRIRAARRYSPTTPPQISVQSRKAPPIP